MGKLPFSRKIVLSGVVLIFLSSFPLATRAWDNGVALTPPMGWNSWNKFGCNVSEDMIKSMADAMVASGMKDAGYEYVVIDDCWQVSRDAAGNKNFPLGHQVPCRLRPFQGLEIRNLFRRRHHDLRQASRQPRP